MKSKRRISWRSLFLTVIVALFFVWVFFTDNKYVKPPSYGNKSIIELKEADFDHTKPLTLIDGWLLTDTRVENLSTYIGEFSSLQRGDRARSPHGNTSYQLMLHYTGRPIEVMISFSQLFNRYTFTLNDVVLSKGDGGASAFFTLSPGDHFLKVETASRGGYYRGMIQPPILGKTEVVLRTILIQCIAYGVAFFIPLALALFAMIFWSFAKDATTFWFGLLCCCFSLYVSSYYVRLLSFPVGEYWFLIQGVPFYGFCFCMVRLTALFCGVAEERSAKWVQGISGLISILLLVLAILIPVITWAVGAHGILIHIYYVFIFCGVLFFTWKSRVISGWENCCTQLTCIAFGAGLLYNLFAPALFEPILFFWQFEWSGLLLVVLFGAMIVPRNKRILMDNETFQNRLEVLVGKRTEEQADLIRERKEFFVEMAHDLKAPIFATESFIQAIRENDTRGDAALLRYIDLIEQKQQEMARSVQGLLVLSKMDEFTEPFKQISVQKLLKETYHAYSMEAEVQAIQWVLKLPESDGMLYAQPGKMVILLENLIVNALRATKRGGEIILSAEIDAEGCHLSISDTGNGILPEVIPHIFERFYVGKENQIIGSGLGLYIVKSIVNTMKGEIYVSSKPGYGSIFFIDLPLAEK